MVIPVEHLAVDHDEDERAAHQREHHHIAELRERQRHVFRGIGVVGHGEEDDEHRHNHRGHHGIVHILPLIVVGKPGGEPGTYLPEYHEEEVDGGHARGLLRIEFVPSLSRGRLVARGHVDGGLDTEGILDEGEEVAHEQGLPHESHHQTAQGEQEEAGGVGADEAQHREDGESGEAHEFLAADAHQRVEKGRESRHSHRGDKAHEGDMFRLDAEAAHHLTAVGGIDTAHGHDGDEEQHQEDDTQWFGHPVMEREVLVHTPSLLISRLSLRPSFPQPAARCPPWRVPRSRFSRAHAAVSSQSFRPSCRWARVSISIRWRPR